MSTSGRKSPPRKPPPRKSPAARKPAPAPAVVTGTVVLSDEGIVIPDDPYMVRNSERSTYKHCRQQWYWGWVEKLQPIQSSTPLRFGGLVHQALAEWYRPGMVRGMHPADAFEALYDREVEANFKMGMRDADTDEWVQARDLGIDMLRRYVEHYGTEPHIEVLQPEMPFQVHLANTKGNKYLVTPVGTFDNVFRNHQNGKVGLFEHKTAKSIQVSHLSLDEQAGTYWALAGRFLRHLGILKDGEDIDVIVYNFLRKAMSDPRPTDESGRRLNKPAKPDLVEKANELGLEIPRGATIPVLTELLTGAGVNVPLLGKPSESQPPAYFEREPIYRGEADRENLLWRLRAEAWEMAEARAGRLPILKTPSYDCARMCAYHGICELHECGGDWEELQRLTMTKWDPYADHMHDDDIPFGM